MLWAKSNKEKPRFYLFAGMGGKAARRKHHVFLAWAILAAILVSAALGWFLLAANHPHPAY